MTLIDIIGWAGSVAVVLAYWLISNKKVQSTSYIYQALNVFGSICLIANTYFNHAYPSTFVNVVWLYIAIAALWKAWRK